MIHRYLILAPFLLSPLANLQITPTIAPANTLALSEEAPIDGSMTLTVKYL